MIQLVETEALHTLRALPDTSVSLVVTDPPWNTGQIRSAVAGSYSDKMDHEDFILYMFGFMVEAWRVLKPEGTLAIWTDYRYSPYFAVHGDPIFGRDNRVGEIIVESLLGNPGKSKWPVKHSNITIFAKDAKQQKFHVERLPEVDRRAGGQKRVSTANNTYDYTGQKKVASVLQGTMSNTDPQRACQYPDQKPDWIYEALVACYTDEGDFVIDPFAGSGTCGAACLKLQRRCLLGDVSSEARSVITQRLGL